MQTRIYWLTLVIAYSLSINCLAQESTEATVGGFISQSWVKTTKGTRLSGASDNAWGSVSRIEAGAYVNRKVGAYLDIRGMISSFKDGAYSDGTPVIDYAIADFHDINQDYGMRLGKVSHSSGFYNELINVPSFRGLEISPQGLYRDDIRNFLRSGKGVQIYAGLPTAYGWQPTLEATRSQAVTRDQVGLNHLIFSIPLGTFVDGSILTELSVKAVNKGTTFRYDLDHTSLNFIGNYPYATVGTYTHNVHRFGARQYFETGDLTAEYSVIKLQHCDNRACPGIKPVAYDITYKHYLTDNLTLIVEADAYFTDYGDRNGTIQSRGYAAMGLTIRPEFFYSKSMALGLKYSTNKWTYKAEIHKVKGLQSLTPIENNINASTPSGYNILLLNVTHTF